MTLTRVVIVGGGGAGDAAAFALAVRSGRLPRTRGYLAAASGVAGAVAGLGSAAGLLRR
jgi:hypothetical protein